jgi:hemerythrin superfamily protein
MAKRETQHREDKTQARDTSGRVDAVDLLTQDHRQVERLFKRFEEARGENQKSAVAERVCQMLKVHTHLEEELFYPAAREQIDDPDLVDEAIVEHQTAKDLVEKIESAAAGDGMFEAEMKVLQEQIAHHVEEEESELFPEVRESGLDLADLGRRISQRKVQLMRELGLEAEERPGESRAF